MSRSFEWDEAKSLNNKKKHGVSFAEAASVFQDAGSLCLPDPDHSDLQELRFLAIGMSAALRILTVVHCERDADTIRIISARKATPAERRQYEGA